MSGIWSERVEQRYSLRLPPDVRAWLDQEVWRDAGGAEFHRAQTPDQLVDPEPGIIWGGFMLPDTLPLVGNDYGDWLCLRIAGDGSVAELLHWSHCGGDWIPYGRTLAEGLIYDAALHLLSPDRPSLSGESLPADQVFRLAQWARPWIDTASGRRATAACQGVMDDGELPSLWHALADAGGPPGSHLLALLLDWQIAEFVVRRDRIVRHLESPLKVRSGPALAQRLGWPWEPDFVSWLFDTRQIPVSVRQQLSQQFQLDGHDLMAQDWEAAEREAMLVLQKRSDLGWAFDVAGWAAQRRGDERLAVQRYLAGLQTSWFSDDTVRFRTHWFEEGYGKFAAAQLATLLDQLSDAQRRDPYLAIFLDKDPRSLRPRVQAYWLELARTAEQHGDHRRAYQYYYRAGWDLGLHPISEYVEVFAGLCRTATAAGMPALAAIARTHQQFLVGAA